MVCNNTVWEVCFKAFQGVPFVLSSLPHYCRSSYIAKNIVHDGSSVTICICGKHWCEQPVIVSRLDGGTTLFVGQTFTNGHRVPQGVFALDHEEVILVIRHERLRL